MKHLSFGIIFFDNPIGRSYLNFLSENNFYAKEIIILINKKYRYFPKGFASSLNCYFNNYHALQLLSSKLFLINSENITNFFNFDKNFIKNMYKKINFENISSKITYVYIQDINSDNLKKLIDGNKKTYLYTGGGILKKSILNTQNKFLHIHPGFLPKIRGADGVLWSLLKSNSLGVSSFYLNNKIDQGNILSRENLAITKLTLNSDKNISNKTYYRFIYSFIDPLLRTYHLRNIINDNIIENSSQLIENEVSKGEYYSFMEEDNFEIIKNKIFK